VTVAADMAAFRPRVLVSAYACGPNWGSEIGMGWNWAVSLSKLCDLTVITEGEFREDIENALDTCPCESRPRFHYLPVAADVRRRCWNQGDWRFYSAYRAWQERAFELASELVGTQEFDIVHQLNMIGYREPGYLWKLGLPFVWGPIGGYAQMPWRFMRMLGMRSVGYYVCRNILNAAQSRISTRVRRATSGAKMLIAATEADRDGISRVHGRDSLIINEQGCDSSTAQPDRQDYSLAVPLRLVWCGRCLPGKLLSIALYALSKIDKKERIELEILGDGVELRRWRQLAQELSVEKFCRWRGKVEHSESLRIIGSSHVMLMTSLLEGTPAVIMEALMQGVPVVCHDACGFSTVVTKSCGIKIPVISPVVSIQRFAEAISRLASDPELVANLSEGAMRRAGDLSWENRAREMLAVYRSVLAALHPAESGNVGV